MKTTGMWLLLAISSGVALGVIAKQSRETPIKQSPPLVTARIERPAPAAIPPPSEVTIEDLLAPGRPDRFVLFAGWLPQATSADLQRLWEAWKDLRPMTTYRKLLLARWVELDLVAARAEAGSHTAFWEAWISHDPETAASEAWKSGDLSLIYRVKNLLIAHDPELARKLFAAQGNAVSETELATGYQSKGRFREAMDAVSGTDKAFRRHDIFAEWLKSDPEGALDWAAETRFELAGNGIDDEKRMLELIRPHADKARSLIARLPAGRFRQRVEAGLVTALAEKDPQAALGFARSLASPRAQQRALAAVGMGLTKSDPEAAVQVYSELVSGGARPGHEHVLILYGDKEGCSPRDSLFDPFVDSLMNGLPDRALNAAMAMESGPVGDAAVEDLATRWMSRDLWEFSKWLATQPQNTRRDGLAGELVDRMLTENRPNYQQAAQWIGVIGDTKLASNQAERLVSNWRWADPEGLDRYLNSGTAARVIVETNSSSR